MPQLHGGGAHPSGRTGDEHPFGGAQVGLGEQGIVCGAERLGEPTRLVPGDPLGHRHGHGVGHHGQLRLGPAAGDGHDPVADGEPGGPRSEAYHLPGELHAGDVLGEAGRWRVEALLLEEVGGQRR